jgi:hypothetical protein
MRAHLRLTLFVVLSFSAGWGFSSCSSSSGGNQSLPDANVGALVDASAGGLPDASRGGGLTDANLGGLLDANYNGFADANFNGILDSGLLGGILDGGALGGLLDALAAATCADLLACCNSIAAPVGMQQCLAQYQMIMSMGDSACAFYVTGYRYAQLCH